MEFVERARGVLFHLALKNGYIRKHLFEREVVEKDPQVVKEHKLVRLGRGMRSKRRNIMVAVMLGIGAAAVGTFIHRNRK